jgi:hypothetical protein
VFSYKKPPSIIGVSRHSAFISFSGMGSTREVLKHLIYATFIVSKMLPNSLLIYSQILPRKKPIFFPVGLWVVRFSAFAMIDDPIIHIFLLNRPENFHCDFSKPIKIYQILM